MGKEEDISRKIVGVESMGIKDNNSEFWYQKADGSWRNLGEITSLSIDLPDEAVAALSRALVPLGDLEIVPREE